MGEGETRFVGLGKTHDYPYPVCKKYFSSLFVTMYLLSFERQCKLQPRGSRLCMTGLQFSFFTL